MKILKTKQEKKEEAEQKAEVIVAEISAKVEKYKTVSVVFNREDFNAELKSSMGVSNQDLKKKFRIAIDKLESNYKIKAEPGNSNFEVVMTISKKKAE